LSPLQKHLAAYLSVVIIFLIVVSSVAVITPMMNASPHPFYVGVTYCGDSVEEAKQLIDKVKTYTNLFVLQSGSFLYSNQDIDEIGDYAVNCGLNIILYCGGGFMANNLSVHASQRWGTHFLGIYFSDEPGGKLIDKVTSTLGSTTINTNGLVSILLHYNDTARSDITFYSTGLIQMSELLTGTRTVQTSINKTINNQTYTAFRSYTIFSSNTDYYPNGTITYKATKYNETDDSIVESNTYIYQPDGVIHDREDNNGTDKGNIPQFSSYQELYDLNPLGSYVNMADTFANNTLYDLRRNNQYLNKSIINPKFDNFFTSDYALYWFDYKSGYNTVFAEFVGNESRARHIALCRGAAETLGKDWGVMVTWKYNQLPYLESGDELYNDLALAYSSGAKYGIVFTYPNITAYGTLTDEHFEALHRFWNTLKTNPSSFGNAESKVAYVIPADYGFGFRSANDTIWGYFPADELSAKIYSDTTALTAKYGAKLNILYDGVETAAKLGGYSAVYYYNRTVT
jgi:hypothetical protein